MTEITTPEQFEAELARLGFVRTDVRTALTTEWRHVSGACRFITDPHRVPPHALKAYLLRIKRSIGGQ